MERHMTGHYGVAIAKQRQRTSFAEFGLQPCWMFRGQSFSDPVGALLNELIDQSLRSPHRGQDPQQLALHR